jgi:uridylate kinase
MSSATPTRPTPKYRRILLKLSGEALGTEGGYGINSDALIQVALQIKEVRDLGVEVVIVIGGGNIFRGLQGSQRGIERATGDYMGMLATVINALALQDALEKQGTLKPAFRAPSTSPKSPNPSSAAAPSAISKRVASSSSPPAPAIPYFSTDTAAALRAAEISADVILKATKVDGIYDRPQEEPERETL